MVKIPTYFRGKLASEQTGVNTPDRSGEMMAKAVGGAADAFFQIAAEAEARSKSLVDQSLGKTMGNYQSEYMLGADKIKKEGFEDPRQVTEKLKKLRENLTSKYSDSLSGSSAKRQFDADLNRYNATADIKDTQWQIETSVVNAKINYTQRISGDAMLAAQVDTEEGFTDILQKFQDEESNIISSFGADGLGVMKQGREAIAKGFIIGMKSRGESFKASQLLTKGYFKDYINVEDTKEIMEEVRKAAEGDEKQRDFDVAVGAANDMFQNVDDYVSITPQGVIALEEKISQLSFQIGSPEEHGLNETQVSYLKTQQEMLLNLREVAQDRVFLNAKEDPEDMARLTSIFQSVVQKQKSSDGGREVLGASIDDVLKFQRDITDMAKTGKMGKISFDKWMFSTEVAIANSVEASLVESHKVAGFGRDSGFEVPPSKKLSSSKKIRAALKDIFINANERLGAEHLVNAVDYYMDELYNLKQNNPEAINDLTPEIHQGLVKKAKVYSSLKALGLPVYLTVGDKVSAHGGSYEIVGNDRDGMPIIKTRTKKDK